MEIRRGHNQSALFSHESLSFVSDFGYDVDLKIVSFHEHSQRLLLRSCAWRHQVRSSVTLLPTYFCYRRVDSDCDDSGDRLHLKPLFHRTSYRHDE